ncbi:CypX Cytochrome P450 [Pyrenophora tritici-repentis]|uniref:Cytochrome P450 monooxygenase n=1 Tax=Pyrenophora tritici-repentis TaxID=45151 RepID=A0A2W1CRE6_9PLEO|nr:BcABA1 cytochrome P450 monooxygenase [Pyrenophora tritici-repentis]KAI0569755.1 BcABA1 cytochrome P450 monooxygenase [Pyrenophora tritici-repentis]KAI0572119.1 BcABA1 cytochrome P450 monooxygenase [Pyrenophora tritici-repentis]KAI0606299.1 BcABA1 cytochrome P450 monooxygenase [Pyrenophora tritici-repentis]KAI1516680.1 cytochrome P450 monooxygenase [Pyrenophora tritici-repentis]
MAATLTEPPLPTIIQTAHPIFYIALTLLILLWATKSLLLPYLRLRHIPAAHPTTPFSYLWLGRTTYSGRQYQVLRDLHTQHGPLVRIGPNEVLTDDPVVLRTVSATRSNYARSDWYQAGRFNPYHDNLFTILEPGAHKRAKARSMAAYNGRETLGLEVSIDEQVRVLVDIVRGRYAVAAESPEGGRGKPLLDLGKITCYFTMDVITRLGFGKAVGYLIEEMDHYDFLKTVDELWPRMSTVADVPWIRKFLFSKFVLGLVGPKNSDRTGFGALMGFAADQVHHRFAAPDSGKKDFLASLIARGFTEEECQSEGLFLLLAGSESTANALRSILVHTMSSPVAYNRLIAEIEDAVRTEKVSYPITLEQAQKLPYLQAVIYEGIRMRPPLLGLFPKIVPANESPIFNGKLLPPGTAVCMNMSSMLQSTALFGVDAAVFRPERFSEADSERRRQMEQDVEMVFGYGGWVCAGKTIAMMDMVKVVFELFRVFELQLVRPLEPCNTLSYGVFLEKGLMVKVSERA